MRWRKLGKLFDPLDFELARGCSEFAQSPQALVFDDYVRIYFSSRARDEQGQYLSYIFFVDMERDLSQILRIAERPVIELGKLGCHDEHGIFPMNVVRHRENVYGYTCGWSRRISVPVETAIGLAISQNDGLTFERIGDGPIMSASLREPFLVGDPFVRIIENTFHMWYIFGTRWSRFSTAESPECTYKIGHAVSGDGISWEKEEGRQIVADVLGPEEAQALPSVIAIDDDYHMVFCYRASRDFRTNRHRSYRIGHARSTDLVNWTRDDASLGIDVSEDRWDSDMMCYPHIFEVDGRIFLLYNGNEFGRRGFGAAVLE